jgi:dephospho-CoA kinase
MARRTPWVVALTGGVASGKSAVARRFEALGVNVHDADVAARAVVEPGSPALSAIAESFGADALLADGTLDRRAMRAAVFADADARRRLEAIVHPRIRDWLRARVDADTGAYCMLAIPLLIETWPQYAWVDRVLLVDASDDRRMQRLMRRDGIDRATAERMLAAQATHAQRVALADDVIDNNGDEAALDTAVAALHQRYLALANAL